MAAMLVAPTKAAGALDAVGRDGFSALLWAEERGMHGVAKSLRGRALPRRGGRCRGRRAGANRGLYGQLCDGALGAAVPAGGQEILRDGDPHNRT